MKLYEELAEEKKIRLSLIGIEQISILSETGHSLGVGHFLAGLPYSPGGCQA